jgi:hypothetical protein
MAWVPGYQYDVFISYSHVDNLTPDNDSARGWVAQFHKRLEVALAQKAGRSGAVSIWRDERQLEGNLLFDKSIQDGVRGSAVFVSLYSHGYAASSYCADELKQFHEKARAESLGLAAGDAYRIFPVFLNRFAPAQWPPEFGRTSGFQVNDSTRLDEEGEPSDPSSDLFRTQLRVLKDSLFGTLDRLRELTTKHEPEPTGVHPPGAQSDAFRVFLADVADALTPVRRRVINELRQQPSLEILSSVPPPMEADAHRAAAASALASADLSVHLFSDSPGREIENLEGVYYPQTQAEIAMESGKAQIVWVPDSLKPENIFDPAHAQFLAKVESGKRDRDTVEFVRTSPSAVTAEILAKIEHIRSRANTPEEAPGAALIDTHFKDQLQTFDLMRYLVERKVQPYLNPQEDNPSSNLDIFTQRLKQVSLLIVFYGAVAEEWVRARLGVAIQIAIAENFPLRACGVYVAPPHKSGLNTGSSQRFIRVDWMDHTGGFDGQAIDRLLARARSLES